jgi:hypothetical protein
VRTAIPSRFSALPQLHRFEDLPLRVDHADAGGGERLVAGEDVEISIQRLHVDPHVGYRLGAVDQHAAAVAVRRSA